MWENIKGTEEATWLALGRAVKDSLPEEDWEPFFSWVLNNYSIQKIYVESPDRVVDLWDKRKAKKSGNKMEMPNLWAVEDRKDQS